MGLLEGTLTAPSQGYTGLFRPCRNLKDETRPMVAPSADAARPQAAIAADLEAVNGSGWDQIARNEAIPLGSHDRSYVASDGRYSFAGDWRAVPDYQLIGPGEVRADRAERPTERVLYSAHAGFQGMQLTQPLADTGYIVPPGFHPPHQRVPLQQPPATLLSGNLTAPGPSPQQIDEWQAAYYRGKPTIGGGPGVLPGVGYGSVVDW